MLTSAMGIAVILASTTVVALAGRHSAHQRLLDAQALFSELEPICGSDAAPASSGAGRARRALARETLALLAELLEDRRQMSAEERTRRADRYAERLSDAVSERLEAEAVTDSGEGSEPGVAREQSESEAERVADSRATPPGRSADAGASEQRSRDPQDPIIEPEQIVIRSATGESWAEIRARRTRERSARAARWRPLVERELGPVIELRRLLALELESDSLAGATSRCARLGIAAGKADRVVARTAPDRTSEKAVARLLDAYQTAGRACSASNYALAFVALDDGDGAWRRLTESAGVGAARLRVSALGQSGRLRR